MRRDGRVERRLWERASLAGQYVSTTVKCSEGKRGRLVHVPFNLGPDDIDDLVRQAGNVLVAQVNGNAGLLLLQLARRLCGSAVVDVLAGVLEGRLGECHHLVVRDGRGRVVAHDERARSVRGESIMAVVVAYMLFAWTATVKLK